jgi:uncharacterized protein (UPF0332 family)
MSNVKKDLVDFRLARATESFKMASLAVEQKYWNAVASELYYTCYYLVIALFAKNDIKTSTHSGIRTELGLKFIKKGTLDVKWGRLISTLFNLRQKGDYGDFVFLTEEEILPLVSEVRDFDILIRKKLQD